MLSLKKILTWTLISLLLFQEIFRLPLILPSASALEVSAHEDIVALVVEQDVLDGAKKDIEAYALRVQSLLPQTRTVVLSFPRDAHPFLISSTLERLYFSGIPDHGKKTQKLVGAIFVGHVPLPVVHRDGQKFLSMFPYTDFDQPHFVWNPSARQFGYLSTTRGNPNPDIWHSVIDPNTGNLERDIGKIRDFFARVYEYDKKEGRYAEVGRDPQVLYMDTVNESGATSNGLLAVYDQLLMPYQEDLIYHRYTRDFSQYLYENFLTLMRSEGEGAVVPFSEWKKTPESSSSFLDDASDISTRVFSEELLMPFLKVVNEKYIGDVRRWIHNAGRYYNGYSDVSVDTFPALITQKDTLSTQIIKEVNDTLEKIFDSYVDSSMSLDIPILLNRSYQKTITEVSGEKRQTRTYDFMYENYFFGSPAGSITDARHCSLYRGSTFDGRGTSVEINHGYNLLAAEKDSALITQDTQSGISCNPLTSSYWGGNTPLNITYQNSQPILGASRRDDISQPIYDLGGSVRSGGKNSPLDCLSTDLILKPYQHIGFVGRRYNWPTETGGQRYSCATSFSSATPGPFGLDPTPESQENILTRLTACTGEGSISILGRDGKAQTICAAEGLSGAYKRISSLVRHNDPERELYGAQVKSITSPHIPVDAERFLLYLNREGKEGRVKYPNIFDIPVLATDTDEIIEKKIIDYLNELGNQLVPGKIFTPDQPWYQLIQSPIEKPDLSQVLLSNPDIKKGLIDALRWNSLDIEMKYSHALDISVSDRGVLGDILVPEKKKIYEIAYLGGTGDAQNFVFGYSPDSNKNVPSWFQDVKNVQSDYSSSSLPVESVSGSEFSLTGEEMSELVGEGGETSGEATFSCGDPTGVVIWEWPAAIQCWLSDILNNDWFTPEIDDVSFPTLASIDVRFDGEILWSTKELKPIEQSDTNNNLVTDYVEKNAKTLSLKNTFSDTVIPPRSSFRVDTSLEDETYRIDDDLSRVEVVITRIDDLENKKIYTPQDADWIKIRDSYISISGSGILRDGHIVWSMRSLNDTRARIFMETRLYSADRDFVVSDSTSVLVGRPDPLTVVSSANTENFQTLIAGDPDGLKMVIGGDPSVGSTARVEIFNYITSEPVAQYQQVPLIGRSLVLRSPAIDSVLRKTGKYRIKVTSADVSAETIITVIPGPISNVTVSAAPVFLLQQPQKINLEIKDAWGNNITIDDDVVVRSSSPVRALQGGPGLTEQVIPFSQTISLIPTVTGNLDLDFSFQKNIFSGKISLSRQVISEIRLVADVSGSTVHEVGKDVTVNFSLQRQDGSIIESWDTPLSLRVSGGSARLRENVVNFSGGKGAATLSTGARPSTIYFTLSDIGFGKIVGPSIQIIPGSPERLTLQVPETIRAKVGARDTVRVLVYDRFGNPTNIGNSTISLEQDAETLSEPLVAPQAVRTGVYDFDLISRGYPGRLLLRAWVQNGENKSDIPTLEDVANTTFLPVIDSADAEKNNWNTLTQVLLGGPFGQSPVQGYLAGSLLFAPDTKTLSISTLIDTIQDPIVTISPRGGISLGSIEYGTGLTATVDAYNDGALAVRVSDNRIGNIARITYPKLSPEVSYLPCDTTATLCGDTITFVPLDDTLSYNNGNVLRDGFSLFSVKDIFMLPNLRFDFLDTSDDVLQFVVFDGDVALGVVQLSWSERLPVGDNPVQNTFFVESLKGNLSTRSVWSQFTSHQVPGLMLYDPQENIGTVGGSHKYGWSQYPEVSGIGWTGENRSLLQFASGQAWGASQKDHSDYLTINIGDPLISLPNYNVHPVTGLDHTLGLPVYQSDLPISDITFRDINNDDRDDLIVFHDNGTVGTRLVRDSGAPLDIGDLFSVKDASRGMIRSGDFVGDGYSDIVYVDLNGRIKFVSYDAQGPTEKAFEISPQILLGQISQIEVFDMDYDQIDDIVILDQLGTLVIFYGTKTGIFTSQVVDQVYDFAFSSIPQSHYFSGAIRYRGPGFVDPDDLPLSGDAETLVKQERIRENIFTQIGVSQKNNSPQEASTQSLGNVVYESLNNDVNGFMRGYDGDAAALGTQIKTGYDALQKQAGNDLTITTQPVNTVSNSIDLLKSPFVDQSKMLIQKKYSPIETGGKILPGSPVLVTLTLKNTSSQIISDIILLEKYPSYLSVSDATFEGGIGTDKKIGKFTTDRNHLQAGIADLGKIQLLPEQTYTLTYKGSLRSFSFGRFDVGYLEDAQDPTSNKSIPRELIRTIQETALQKESISEKEFYNHDNYGDIRFNPNNTCGGPLLLWRSHNDYERTYHKIVIVRDVQDPQKKAVDASSDPTKLLQKDPTEGLTTSAANELRKKEAKADLAEWQADGDGDSIPDSSDDDHGDVFEIETQGNTTQISIGLGKFDAVIDDVTEGVNEILAGLSCGFGSAGCISTPINWAANIPGNTITLMGYAVPLANQPPVACHKDVRCGVPVFSYPTNCCESSSVVDLALCATLTAAGSSTNVCTWPSAYGGAGGAFDYSGSVSVTGGNGLSDIASSNGSVSGKVPGVFMPGRGISQFRLFAGATLTGAVAAVTCFGPNTYTNPSINYPGLFPIRFDGNCVFATAPILQCKDDGSGETPLIMELDIDEVLDDQSGDGSDLGNQFINADECGFYDPIASYPQDVGQSVAGYLSNPSSSSTDNLQTILDKNFSLTQNESHDNSLSIATLAPDDSYSRLNNTRGLAYESTKNGTGMIQISLDPSELKFKNFGDVVDIELTSIRAFPNFIMDWYHRQLDEIVSSITNLPDIKIVLPQLSGLADSGWVSSFSSGATNKNSAVTASPNSQTQSPKTPTSTNNTISSAAVTAPQQNASQEKGVLAKTGESISKTYNKTFDTISGGLKNGGNAVSNGLGSVENVRNSAAGFIQQKTTGIQNAFEYLGTLPIIDVHPETISFNLPWVGKQEAQSWIARNEAILQSWKNLPADAANSVIIGPMVASIESNIETVKTYLELPEKLQNLFYLKEKLLYGILQNIQAVQELMGGWLYENGVRFRAWVETFILVTKLWDLWQVLIDVFDDYEKSCAVCQNERWNLKQWLWIVISLIIPPIPVIAMPRWPDIELDFSDIDLSIDVAYPVFDLSFYPLYLPDAPVPTVSGFPIKAMPQLPPLPDLDIDFEIPVIQLPDLPDLPPPPKIPELSQAIEIVLKIFKLIVLIECLYKKVPLSPEWVVGTKVAHKTERQGYLPFDFLDIRYPTVTAEWIDTIRVATHVNLQYDVTFVTDMIRTALEPFTDFPKNLDRIESSGSVDFDLNAQGVDVETASLDRLPSLLGSLFALTRNPQSYDVSDTKKYLQNMSIPDLPLSQQQKIYGIIENDPEVTFTHDKFSARFALMRDSLERDIDNNKTIIAELGAWSEGKKSPENIAFLSGDIPGTVHLANAENLNQSYFLNLSSDIFQPLSVPSLQSNSLNSIPQSTESITPSATRANTPNVPEPSTLNRFTDTLDTSTLRRTQGLYVVRGSTTQRLIDFTEALDGKSKISARDDDGDGDEDVYYTLGKIVYRKENHSRTAEKYFIKDRPQYFNIRSIYTEFFGLSQEDITTIYSSGQIDLLRTHSAQKVNFKYLSRENSRHMRLDLYPSLDRSRLSNALYRVDILPENDFIPTGALPTLQHPFISDVDGQATIIHKKPYRILLTDREYFDDENILGQLPEDFTIRSGQSGYARESSIVFVTSEGSEKRFTLRQGERLFFPADSQVRIGRGSLILFSATSETRLLTQKDVGLPLLPEDKIIASDNGQVQISFADATQTDILPRQNWSLVTYDDQGGIQNSGIDVSPDWYYGILVDARTLAEERVDRSTIFNTSSSLDLDNPLPKIPREISLLFDRPTTVDIQSFFPYDTISSVEVLGLASSEWRRDAESTTKLVFLTQKESRDISLRININGIARDYTTKLVTRAPEMIIDSAISSGEITGSILSETLLPIGIQTMIDGTIWNLSSGVSLQGLQFTSSLKNPLYTFGSNSQTFTINRDTGSITPSNETKIEANIQLGSPLGISVTQSGETVKLAYTQQKMRYAQVAAIEDIKTNGVYVIGSALRLEPSTNTDASLPGGVYITDETYGPLVALDVSGNIRYLDSSITFSVSVDGDKTIFTLSRNRSELGKIIIYGSMTTHWNQQ